MLGRGTSKFAQLVQQDCYCFSLLWGQKHRGKKWRARCWAHDEQTQQNKVDRYEKRLKRRAGNRELKTLLHTNGNEFPSLLQFEERVKRATKGKVLPLKGPAAARPKEAPSEEATSSSPGMDASHHTSSWNEARSHWNSAAASQMRGRHHVRVWAQWARLHRRAFRHEFQADDSSSAERSSSSSFWASFGASWSQRHSSQQACNFCGGSAGHSSDHGSYRHAHAGYQRSMETDSAAVAHLTMLGLSSTSGIDAGSLRKAFLKCAMQWHPDRHTGSERGKMHAEEKFKQIQISYAFLQSYLAI